MEKIWLRFGGFAKCTAEQKKRILDGSVDALVDAIKAHGIELDGQTYDPQTEVEWEIDKPMKLTLSK